MFKRPRCRSCGSVLPRGKPYCPSCGLYVIDDDGRRPAPVGKSQNRNTPAVRRGIMVAVITLTASLTFSIIMIYFLWKFIGLI